ncbi:MAG: ATP-dependent helicase [Salibacteraceae bacterium]
MDYLEGLNESQRKAVEHTEGPVMVIAGAGSGKTRVLTMRVAYLIQKGVDPFRILSLTFTNKAAREMKDRIGNIVGEGEARNIWMGTFHSIFARILRVEAEKLGYPANFTIYDTDDSKSLLRTIIKEMNLDDKVYKPNLVLNRISSAKNNLLSARAYNANTTIQSDDVQSRKPLLGKIYETYERRCFKAGAMDFDDLLFKTNVLLRDYPDVLYKYQRKFRYVMVDEFQDTNFSQYKILKALAAQHENICVVGDDAQSIYAFRGADIANILNFQKEYPDAGVYKLEQNYRSTKNIVSAANSIIDKNKDQLKKEVWTANDTGERIEVFGALTDNEEGSNVAHRIFNLSASEAMPYSDFSILYRTNSQSRSMEEGLRKLNIPYKIYGGLSFYQRKEIKDLLGYVRLTLNPADEEALKRIINYPKRGLGNTTVERLVVAANTAGVSIWDIITNPNQYQVQLSGAVRNKLNDFVTMIQSFQALLDKKTAYEVGHTIASHSGILKELYSKKDTPEDISRYENVQELLAGLKEFSENATADGSSSSLELYMQDIALLTDVDKKDQDDDGKPRVTLMTVHSAKVREFPFVFIVGMEENLFPSQLALNSRSELEEERRLFYVAITRAEQKAYISYATSRYRWGNLIYCEPSRFIEEIDSRFINEVPGTAGKGVSSTMTSKTATATRASVMPKPRNLVTPQAAANKPGNFAGDDLKDLQVGMQVEHERFGKGKVLNLEGAYPNQKATVFFQSAGNKQLLLKFAKLKIVS